MKTFLSVAIILVVCLPCFAQVQFPSASPTQTVHQQFALGAIDLDYSRPGMKGRKIFGALVPYDKVWRTGANGATVITFSDEVTIGGTKIPAGKYGLLTMPNSSDWTIIITKQLDVNQPALYKPENDLVKVNARVKMLDAPVETFTMEFADVKQNSCNLIMKWETSQVVLPIQSDIDTRIMMQIDTAIIGSNPPYYSAAGYYFNNGKDLHKAEEWAKKATAQDPDAFYMFYLLAEIQEKLGKKAEAVATATKSIELSKKAQNQDYVALNEKLIARLK